MIKHTIHNFRSKKSPQRHQNSNIDEDTSGYLSDSRTSPIMWSNHQLQTQRRLSKDYPNYIYPNSMVDMSNGINTLRLDENRKRQTHKIDNEANDNENETDFSIPKYSIYTNSISAHFIISNTKIV